jgi:hypothetical protein
MNQHKTGTYEDWPYKVAHDASDVAVSQRRY